jgi:hypothetical protein
MTHTPAQQLFEGPTTSWLSGVAETPVTQSRLEIGDWKRRLSSDSVVMSGSPAADAQVHVIRTLFAISKKRVESFVRRMLMHFCCLCQLDVYPA